MKTKRTEFLPFPLASSRSHDMLVWKHEATGEYFVKSRYRALVTEKLQNNDQNLSTVDKYKDFCNTLWTMHIPTKVKVHMWRLFNNYVPYFSNLFQRRLNVDVVCPLCKEVPEDSNHLMWSCGVLQQLQASLNITMAPVGITSNCKDWLVNTFHAAAENNKQVLITFLWALWHRKNKMIHEGLMFSMHELLGFIRGYCQEITL